MSSKPLVARVKSATRRLARRVALLLLVSLLAYATLRALAQVQYTAHTYALIRWLRHDVGIARGCAAIVALTAIGTPLMVTTTPLNVGAGAVYGVFLGSAVSLLGTLIGACICFGVARFVAREWAQRKIRESASLTALDRALVRGGAGIVMLSRLSPLFPFATCSFAFGACQVSTWDFALGTGVGLAPGTLMMSYIGWNLKQYTKAGATSGEVGMDAWETRRLWGVVALTVVSGAAVAARVNQIVKQQAQAAERAGVRGSAGLALAHGGKLASGGRAGRPLLTA